MNNFKPCIFIGSSKEGKPIAQLVEKKLSRIADCKIWYRQFSLGTSTYEELVNNLSLYEYGILIATSDDVAISRTVKSGAPRDNIIFEFGLFTGRLGRQRSFLMAESGIRIPSDLSGITLPFFPSTTKNGHSIPVSVSEQRKKIFECCKQIEDHIKGRNQVFDFGFLPSTALAHGYFNNFVLKAVDNLLQSKTLNLANDNNVQPGNNKGGPFKTSTLNGVQFNDLQFTILIPVRLSANMFDHAKTHRQNDDWELVKIDAGGFRPFDFYIHAKESRGGSLKLSDIPITLNALGESIRAYIGKSHIGPSHLEQLLESKELRTFKHVLDHLISANPLTAQRVKTEIVTSGNRTKSGI